MYCTVYNFRSISIECAEVVARYRTGKSFLLDLLARYLKVKAAETAKVMRGSRARKVPGPSPLVSSKILHICTHAQIAQTITSQLKPS